MRSFIRNILLGAGALFAAGVVADDCEGGPWDETVWMGRPQDDPAGNYFCDTKWKQGLVVTGVTIWAEKYHIKGLRFKYSDGSEGDLHGQATGNPDWTPAAPKNSLTWREDETLRAVKMWNNWNDGNGPDAVGRIEVSVGEVKLEVSSDVGDTSKSDNRGTEIPLNSGVLLGARGKQGQWVESLELLFLSDKVVSSTLIDMELGSSLEEWNAKQKGITSVNLGKVLIKNSNQEGGLNKTYLFESSKAVVQGSTFTQEHDHTLGFKVGYSVEFEGGIPIAKAKTSVSTELSYQYTNRQSTQKSDREDFILKWNEGGVLPPQHAAHCTAFAMTGKFDDDYTATMRLELASGQKFDIKQTGRFESIGWTEAQSDCKILSLKEAEGLGPIEEREGESTENETESQRRAVPIHFSA